MSDPNNFTPPFNRNAPQGQNLQKPAIYRWNIYARGPNLPDNQPIAQVQGPDIRGALLMFLANLGGDVTPLREIRIVKEQNLVIVPP